MGKLIQGVNDITTWCNNHGEQGKRILQEWTGINENGFYIDINKVSYGSKKRVLWKCRDCGNEWKTQVNSRINKHNCPSCSGRIASDKNNLLKWCNTHEKQGQRILQEWISLDENGYKVDIMQISYGSNKKMQWKCKECKKIWVDQVKNRTYSLYNCPYCSGKKVSDKNSLINWCINNGNYGQQLLQEWKGVDENENLVNINTVSYASAKRMQWKCKNKHNWIATIANRTNRRSGCPYCINKGTSYPEQFLYQAIKQIFSAAENRYKALKNIYSHGIEFDIAIPVEIDGYKAICIEYSPTSWHSSKEDIDNIKREICQQYNIKYIEIIEDTYNEYQETWTPNLICFHMNQNFQDKQLIKILSYILNSLYHSINEINIQKVKEDAWKYSHGEIPFEQSLANKYPNLIKEWNQNLNKNKTPDQFKTSSHYDVWWKCIKCNNEWRAKIYNRAINKSGCPNCGYNSFDNQMHKNKNNRVLNIQESIAYQYPNLINEWHLNNNKTPDQFTSGSKYEVYWQCLYCGYGSSGEWKTSIFRRTHYKTGCPKCHYNSFKEQPEQTSIKMKPQYQV